MSSATKITYWMSYIGVQLPWKLAGVAKQYFCSESGYKSIIASLCNNLAVYIIESVDSISRDSPDSPIDAIHYKRRNISR